MFGIGFSATTALMPRITPPASSTGRAARISRSGAKKSTSTQVIDGVVVDVGDRPERHHPRSDDDPVESSVPLDGRGHDRARRVGLAQVGGHRVRAVDPEAAEHVLRAAADRSRRPRDRPVHPRCESRGRRSRRRRGRPCRRGRSPVLSAHLAGIEPAAARPTLPASRRKRATSPGVSDTFASAREGSGAVTRL